MATTITPTQIQQLMTEARACDDAAQVAICQRALHGDPTASAACARVIAAAAAQVEG